MEGPKPPSERSDIHTNDHHSEYLARALAALTPAGHKRVDELLEQLSALGRGHKQVLLFARALETEADLGRTTVANVAEPGDVLTEQELNVLIEGFTTIRDQEPLDDVGDWANAVLALLEDERARG